MSEAVAKTTTTDLLESLARLSAADQQSVLSYAQFLGHQQEEEERLRAEDALWEKSFNDPVKMKNFAAFAKTSCEEGPAIPLDDWRL